MLDDELLGFLRTEELWWSLHVLFEAFDEFGEGEIRETLDRLVSQGLVYCDNQRPPWYAAVEWAQ